MKVNPIQIATNTIAIYKKDTVQTQMSNCNSELPVNDHYGRAFVAFNGNWGSIERKIAKVPLEDKLAVALDKLKPKDLLVVSQAPEMINKVLSPLAEKIAFPITGISYLEDKSIKETLVFSRFVTGEMTLYNVNNKPILVNGMEMLLPDDSTEILLDDHIKLSEHWLHVKSEPDCEVDLEKNYNMYVRSYSNPSSLIDLVKTYNSKFFNTVALQKQQKDGTSLTFDSVGGQDANIEALKKNVLFPMKYPDVFKGFMVNRGVILSGPPGTGKTLLAKALVNEAGAFSFELCATDLSDKYVGESEKNCRELFQKAVDAQPSIIYLDEFDALAKARGSQDVYGDKLLNQLLALMSDLEKRGDNVYVIASTNKKDIIDPAILRSGRFGVQLEINAPDLAGTKQILGIHLKDKPVDAKLNRDDLAQSMFDKKMTGAEIADVVKRAFSNALERCGIYKSMEEGRFSMIMMDFLRINKEDFDKALTEMKSDSKERNPIGFKR